MNNTKAYYYYAATRNSGNNLAKFEIDISEFQTSKDGMQILYQGKEIEEFPEVIPSLVDALEVFYPEYTILVVDCNYLC